MTKRLQTLKESSNDQRVANDDFMDKKILQPAPLAYENEQFLKSPDGRILRILAEYIEPLARFRREQIQDTVVFFGSARIPSPHNANNRLNEIRGIAGGGGGTPPPVGGASEEGDTAEMTKTA